jgi:hypothetical protein
MTRAATLALPRRQDRFPTRTTKRPPGCSGGLVARPVTELATIGLVGGMQISLLRAVVGFKIHYFIVYIGDRAVVAAVMLRHADPAAAKGSRQDLSWYIHTCHHSMHTDNEALDRVV